MGLFEVIALVLLAIALAAGVSALVVSIAVRWVHRDKGKHGRPSLDI